MPLTIPLVRDLVQSLKETYRVTSKLRNRLGEVYATYAVTYYSGMFLPYYILNFITKMSSKPFTMAFSNTPGLLKPVIYDGKKSIKMYNYVLPAGHMGIALTCLSYVEYFKICCLTDDAIMKDPQHLVDIIVTNVRWCITEGKKRVAEGTAPIIEAKKKNK